MLRFRLASVSLIAILPACQPCLGQAITDDFQLMGRMRAVSMDCRGAAGSVQEEIVTRFASEIQGLPLELSGVTIEGVSEVGRPVTGEPVAETREFIEGIIHAVDSVGYSPAIFFGLNFWGCPFGRGGEVSFPEVPGWQEVLRRMNGFERVHLVHVSKEYQDRSLDFFLYAPMSRVRDLRADQETDAKITLMQVQSDDDVIGILESVAPVSWVLVCEHGHEYAAASGFKFCPFDGTPLTRKNKGGGGGG